MKVLLFCPFKAVFQQTLKSMVSLKWDGQLDRFLAWWPQDIDRRAASESVRNLGRKLALWGDYDAMLTIDKDMVVPEDALEKLAEVPGAAVVYGLYVFKPAASWNLSISIDNTGGPYRMLTDHKHLAKKEFGKMRRVTGRGFGCTLIRREALEVAFRSSKEHLTDWHFAQDLNRNGLKQKAHLGVVCGHLMKDGQTALWPDVTEPTLIGRRKM